MALERSSRLHVRRHDHPDARHAGESRRDPFTFNQKEGLPLARVAAVFSLSCGAIIDLATAKYAGKGQGEVTLFRQLASLFSQGDVVLADCLMCNWRNFFELGQRRVHFVTRLNKRCGKQIFAKAFVSEKTTISCDGQSRISAEWDCALRNGRCPGI